MSRRSLVLALLLLAAPVHAQPAVEQIAPGDTPPTPGKGRLPRREGMAALSVGGTALVGDGTSGGEAFFALRLAEALGVGGGVTVTEGGADAFVRLDAIGLAINHWAFLGFADYLIDDGWRLGGAAVVPLRRDTYLRLSVALNFEDGAAAGIGMEHDLW